MLPRMRFFSNFAKFPEASLGINAEFNAFTLIRKTRAAADAHVLRYSFPAAFDPEAHLEELSIPSGVKVRAPVGSQGTIMEKSYSPISHPSERGHIDLLVKSYPGDSLGATICEQNIGDEIDMRLKPPRLLQGELYSPNRFKDIALIGNGTGIAPLYQIALTILKNPADTTKVTMVSAHRNEVLLADEIQNLEQQHDEQFQHTSFLSAVEDRRLAQEDLEGRIPEASPETLAIVCGTDGFLANVCGQDSEHPSGFLSNVGYTNVVKL
eukprot:g3000.t1